MLRILGQAITPLSLREVARRSGMAYRSIDLALSDLIAVGVVEDLAGGRERRVRTCSGHRLAPVIAGLLRAEADFFPSLRTELKAIAAGGERDGLLVLAMVGATALREERLGESVEVVLVGSDAPTADRWVARFRSAADGLTKRFGVAFHFTCHDLGTIRALWRGADAGVTAMVKSAESLFGATLRDLVESHSQ